MHAKCMWKKTKKYENNIAKRVTFSRYDMQRNPIQI